jgi:hypothetical protein
MRICEEALEDWKPSKATYNPNIDVVPPKPFTDNLSITEIRKLLIKIGQMNKEENHG